MTKRGREGAAVMSSPSSPSPPPCCHGAAGHEGKRDRGAPSSRGKRERPNAWREGTLVVTITEEYPCLRELPPSKLLLLVLLCCFCCHVVVPLDVAASESCPVTGSLPPYCGSTSI
ncbi:hypothetical protein S245_059404 [Arachis hypogaea]